MRTVYLPALLAVGLMVLGSLQGCATAPAEEQTAEAAAPLNYPTGSLIARRDKSLPSNVKVVDGENVSKTIGAMPNMNSGPSK